MLLRLHNASSASERHPTVTSTLHLLVNVVVFKAEAKKNVYSIHSLESEFDEKELFPPWCASIDRATHIDMQPTTKVGKWDTTKTYTSKMYFN